MTRTVLPHLWSPSPNFEARRDGKTADILLLHYTGMDDAERACSWLCAPESGVSCHYLVAEDGAITQMVEEEKRAWHAGVSSWRGETDVNSRSIGIEIHNPGHAGGYPDFPMVQMDAVIALAKDIAARHGIAAERVLAHSDVAPGRKIDPGEKFDWRKLNSHGLGLWVPPDAITAGPALRNGDSGEAVTAFKAKLARLGYGIDATAEFDLRTEQVTAAFQRHFRPERVDGEADPSTMATLDLLLRRLDAGP